MDVKTEKQCPKCKIVKELADFHKNPARKDGRRSRCKICEYWDRKKYKAREKLKKFNESEVRLNLPEMTPFMKKIDNMTKCPKCKKSRLRRPIALKPLFEDEEYLGIDFEFEEIDIEKHCICKGGFYA